MNGSQGHRIHSLVRTAVLIASSVSAQESLPSFAEPTVRADGSEIAFVSGGDIWTVPSGGGEARLLVSHESDDGRPAYAPDGGRLAFVSDRAGDDDIYILELGSGAVTRLTFGDVGDEPWWHPSGDSILYVDRSGSSSELILRAADGSGTPRVLFRDSFRFQYPSASQQQSLTHC